MAKDKQAGFNPNKLYYSISEVADYLNIAESNIRFWEKEFDSILKIQRTSTGIRQITMKEIKQLEQIKFLLKDCGMTIEGAKMKMSKNKSDVDSKTDLLKRLNGIKEKLISIHNEM